jgi:hypothetical protein
VSTPATHKSVRIEVLLDAGNSALVYVLDVWAGELMVHKERNYLGLISLLDVDVVHQAVVLAFDRSLMLAPAESG